MISIVKQWRCPPHDVAEHCGEYLKKGRSCHVEGRLQTRDWEDRDGNKRYTTEIVADRVTFLGGRGEGGGGGNYGGGGGNDGPPLGDDDIPF